MDDREGICIGLISSVVSLQPEHWIGALSAIAQPILSCLNVLSKKADQLTTDSSAGKAGESANQIHSLMKRISAEIMLLATLVKFFIEADVSKKIAAGEFGEKIKTAHRSATVALLHKSWPALTHIAKSYCADEVSV